MDINMAATRRTRIVCISDTHNQTPKLPPGDLLIHAGDLTNQGTYSELQKTVRWLRQAPFQVKLVVCGNHDMTCDVPFYRQYGASIHNQRVEDPERCIALLRSDPSIVWLNHESREIRLTHEEEDSGAANVTKLRVFGSPYSPTKRPRAFGYTTAEEDDAAASHRLWDQIPLDSDIVVTHTPAKYHRDNCSARGNAAGCETLRQALWCVRPRLFVCGHIHEGYGVEAVTWDLSSSSGEQSIRYWNDPHPDSKKQYKIDLSTTVGVGKSLALRNDGSLGGLENARLETCIVNAAFLAKNWPHEGGKTFHKPVVIDLDLPIENPDIIQ
jgi:Icc-related predicted phosphoesterase